MRRNIVLENNLQKSLDITRIERIIQVVDTPQPRLGMQGLEIEMSKKIESMLQKQHPDADVIILDMDDELLVRRNTKGNMLPDNIYTMTVKEAVEYHAWDTCYGTMDVEVTLSPDEFAEQLQVYFDRNTRTVYAVRNHTFSVCGND